MTDTARAAAALARAGWRVFPCSGKLPLTEHGCLDATDNRDRVAAWWRVNPSANVAIATGHGIVVIDVDGDQGRASLDELERQHGKLPATLTASTGAGTHYYFLTFSELGNTAGKLGPGIDTRAKGGYVIAPPSTHPSGRRYEWASREPMAKLPAWLRDLLKPLPREAVCTATKNFGGGRNLKVSRGNLYAGVCSAYGQRALEAEANAVANAPEGTRNHRLNQAAFSLGQLVAGGELDEQIVRGHLAEAALASGLSEREIIGSGGRMGTLDSGLAAGMRSPRRAPERAA